MIFLSQEESKYCERSPAWRNRISHQYPNIKFKGTHQGDIEAKFKVLILGYSGVGKSTLVDNIELMDKTGKISKVDNETYVLYAVDPDSSKTYEVELIEYSVR